MSGEHLLVILLFVTLSLVCLPVCRGFIPVLTLPGVRTHHHQQQQQHEQPHQWYSAAVKKEIVQGGDWTYTSSSTSALYISSAAIPAVDSSSTTTSAAVSVITKSGTVVRIRRMTANDIPTLATLCIATFRPSFEWWQGFSKWQEEFSFKQNLSMRKEMLDRKKIQHAMLVAEDPETSKLLSFMEIGMLPPPPSKELWQRQDLLPKTNENHKPSFKMSFNAFLGYVERDPTREVPYLANLVVVEAARGKGIGRSMVEEGQRLAAEEFKAPTIYVAVEPDNDVATKLYEKMGFDFIVQEKLEHAKRRKRSSRRKYYAKKLLLEEEEEQQQQQETACS